MTLNVQLGIIGVAVLLISSLTTGKVIDDSGYGAQRQLAGEAKDCDVICPDKSKSTRFCPTSLDECECLRGFRKEGDVCVCDSECPANSIKKGTVDCPRNPTRNCRCERGFEFIGKECKCVSKSCASAVTCDDVGAYQCPEFSVSGSITECPSSFIDCVCIPGYRKNRMRTRCKCNSECPANSEKKEGVDCPTNIARNCICDDGYKFDKKTEKCIADCDFECPAFSSSKLACPKNLTDCECNRGFVRDEENFCVCDKQCPLGSIPRKNVSCPRNLNRHCICDHGFKRVDGECQPDCIQGFQCPANSKPVVPGSDCNFFQCECDEGYVKKNNECVPCASESSSNRAFLPDGIYLLKSHRDGGERDPTYGLRLDGLLTGITRGDIYTFNFDFQGFDDAVEMKMTVHRDTVRITGKAWGGKDIGKVYDPNLSGLWEIDFTYVGVTEDGSALQLKGGSGGFGVGTIKQLFGANRSFELVDSEIHGKAFQFRLQRGHRTGADRDAISGFGWMDHQPIGGGPGGEIGKHIFASDWLFEIERTMQVFNQC